METISKMKNIDYKLSKEGKTSGNYYFEKDQKHISFLKEISKDFLFINSLHFDQSVGTMQIISELISYMIKLFNGNENSVGSTTSGGTESIFMGVYTLRQMGRLKGITKPRIITSNTAHPALNKACYYLNIEIIFVPFLKETGETDLIKISKLIDENTIGVYLSGINYPHGIIDNAEWMNNFLMGRDPKTGSINPSVQSQYDHVGIFVDSCLGGFFTSISAHLKDNRFPIVDFRLEKVWMISCDPHKYGMSPKGCSVLLFRNEELKIQSIFQESQWPGGIYATPSFSGSHSSASYIGAWASLKKLGMDGIIQNYQKIVKVIDKFTNDIKTIPELTIIGNPKGCSIAFKFKPAFEKKFNIVILKELLKKLKKWELSICTKPYAIRISITRNNYENIDKCLINDIMTSLDFYKNNYDQTHNTKSDNMIFYGAVLNLPKTLSSKIVGYFMVYLNKLEKE